MAAQPVEVSVDDLRKLVGEQVEPRSLAYFAPRTELEAFLENPDDREGLTRLWVDRYTRHLQRIQDRRRSR